MGWSRFICIGEFNIEGVSVWVVSPEDLIRSKLHWAGETGSELQLDDARVIVRTVKDLDWIYLGTVGGDSRGLKNSFQR